MRKLLLGDCLERLSELPDGSIDAVICDLPYGTTQAKWDSVIPFAAMWQEVRRVSTNNAPLVFFAAQPFSSALVMSNPQEFRYEWVWSKGRVTGFLDAKKRPLREHEVVLVFGGSVPAYYPQMVKGKTHRRGGSRKRGNETYNAFKDITGHSDEYYPRTILDFSGTRISNHPNEKPVDLCAYLVRTYTNPGETVLDFCMGSGSTGVAALREGRDFVGIERDPGCYATARARILDERDRLATTRQEHAAD